MTDEKTYDIEFGEPSDVEGECNAHLFLGDNYGDNHCTCRCELAKNHDGMHEESFLRKGGKVSIRWEHDETIKLSMREIRTVTGESANVIYDAIKAGHLNTFLIGRRRFARPQAVRDWIDFLERQSNAGKPITYRARAPEHRPKPVPRMGGK